MNEIYVIVGLSLNAAALLAALTKFSLEQERGYELKKNESKVTCMRVNIEARSDARAALKMEIFELLTDSDLELDEILGQFRMHGLVSPEDQIEIRKAVYEMLAEKTLVGREDGTFTADVGEFDFSSPNDAVEASNLEQDCESTVS